MKVEQEKGFAPITITLETEGEAKVMWAALNATRWDGQTNKAILRNTANTGHTQNQMWSAFNDIFRPREVR